MRLLPILSGFVLLSAAASAQPSGGPDQPPSGQYSPPPTAQEQGLPPSAQDQAPPPAQEQGPPPGGRMKFRDRFRAANTTNDGRLTREQATAGGLKGVARHFEQIDTDHKGYVTLQDIRTWRQSLRQMHHAQNAPPPSAPPQ